MPLPSQILRAIPRIVVEENVLHRFWQTTQEMLWASLLLAAVGIALGALLHRFRILRLACETWVGALAAAPIVLMYPLFLVIFGRSATTIVMIGFAAGLAPVILKTLEGLVGNAPRADRRRAQLQAHAHRSSSGRSCCPPRCRRSSSGLRLGLIFAMINIVGVEFLINFGGLGQLINELAERYDLPGTYGAICFVILASVVFFDAAGAARAMAEAERMSATRKPL